MIFGKLTLFLSWTNVFVTLLFGLLLAMALKKRRRHRIPPGPISLPIIGNLLQLGKEAHLGIHEMSKRHGDIFRLYLGQQLVIVISGKKLSTEILLSRSAEFSLRPNLPFFVFSSKDNESFALSPMSAAKHKKRKGLALSALKKTEKTFSLSSSEKLPAESSGSSDPTFAFTDGLETLFGQEAVVMGRKLVRLGKEYHTKYENMLDGDLKFKEEVMKITKYYSIISMCAVIFGQRYSEDDEDPSFISDIFKEISDQQTALNLYASFPLLLKLWKKPLNTFIGTSKALQGLVKMHIDPLRRKPRHETDEKDQAHRNHHSRTSHNVVENLLELKSEDDDETSWKDEIIDRTVTDIYAAGVDTGMTFPLWLFVYSAVFSAERKKVQAEVNTFVDKHHRMPRYSERFDIPLLNAYITEILRHSSFVPFTLPHTSAKDTTINGYLIPQGASIMVSFMSLNWDSNVWENPDLFRPERFINEDGSFDKKLAEKVNVHGGGRRLCAGITISRIQMFASTASLLHTFEIERLKNNKNSLPRASWFISLVPNEMNFVLSERPD